MSKRENLIYTEIAATHKNVFDVGRSIPNPPFVEPGDVVKVYVIKNGDKGESKMNQAELMRQIADAMERNPDGWYREFERQVYVGYCQQQWIQCCSPVILLDELKGDNIRPKTRTYTLHIEGMLEPMREEPDYGVEYWYANPADGTVTPMRWGKGDRNKKLLRFGLCYPDKESAQQAMDKFKAAMGVRDD